jgi:hypothetical protein
MVRFGVHPAAHALEEAPPLPPGPGGGACVGVARATVRGPGWHRAFALLTHRVMPTRIVPTTDIGRDPGGEMGAHATARNARLTDPARQAAPQEAGPTDPRLTDRGA